MTLTPKQELFVDEYLIDLNATQAAIRAGYSGKTANEQGSQLLAKLSIQEAVQEAKAARSERTEITQDWVLKRLKALADADVKRVMTWDADGVYMVDSDELDWEDSYTITEVILKETIKESKGDKNTPDGDLVLHREKRVKQADKKGALELIGKHLGMYTDKIKLQGDAENPLKIDLTQATAEQLAAIIQGHA